MRRAQTTCCCPAYPFPRRAQAGQCAKVDYCQHGVDRNTARCFECDPPHHWNMDAETGEMLPVDR